MRTWWRIWYAAYLSVRFEERQELLDTIEVRARLEKTANLLMRENDLLQIEQKVRDRVRDQMEQGQREYYLNEQIKGHPSGIGQSRGWRRDYRIACGYRKGRDAQGNQGPRRNASLRGISGCPR